MVKNKPTHIVGIGASAGGLEALQSFFENTPSNLGIAFVVIQHLSSDFKSMMDELLKKNTDMRVHQAVEGEEVLANNVYLIPSGKLMRIVEGNIYLSDIPPDSRVNLPINEFFRSLAEDLQNRAIGVVLSGTGSDGSRGVLALKEVGAMVISQDPEEAQFDGMPLSAINTGSVDFVLSTKDMSKQIISFISHPLSSPHSQSKFINHLSEYGDVLDKILTLVQEATDLDFKAYKESTVSRRIEHRMSINNAKSLREYYEYLLKSKDEIELIKQDLLIGVTQFFRDLDVWKNIYETIIPNIVSSTESNEPIRIWSVGSSTGEEPYTIAMLFDRKLKELGVNRHIKVFASDIDQSAVGFGTTGVYPASIETEVPKNYLDEYFNPLVNGNYQVTKELRNMVVFATHNLIQDPPFSNMHLISCRNTLIYLQSPAQQKALAFFHFALKLNGYLLLGSSVNEELYTVNSEYQQKISELTSANSDLENLLKATKLAVLFLDNHLRIRRFTHAFRKYVNIIDFDIDREFKDLSLKQKFNGLHEIIIEVNQTAKSVLQVFEFDAQTIVEASITPYFIGHNQQGVIISMREIERDEKMD